MQASWRSFFGECRRVLKDGGCIHIIDALPHREYAEEFSFEQLQTAAAFAP